MICGCGHFHGSGPDGEDAGCSSCHDNHDWSPEAEASGPSRAQEAALALGYAWQRCEAAVAATGRSFLRLTVHDHNYGAKGQPIPPSPWYYAACNWIPGELAEDGGGPTPAAALNALAARLAAAAPTPRIPEDDR